MKNTTAKVIHRNGGKSSAAKSVPVIYHSRYGRPRRPSLLDRLSKALAVRVSAWRIRPRYVAAAAGVVVLLAGISFVLLNKQPVPEQKSVASTAMPNFVAKPVERATTSVLVELNDPEGTVADDVRILRYMTLNFITAVKEPYQPPLGANEDFVKAFTGQNRYGDVFIPADHHAISGGQFIDRWGTPYHFHARAPDAIDVRSAGPDKVLFTDDDVTSGQQIQAAETMLSKNS